MIRFVHINADTAPTYEFRLRRGGAAVDITGATILFKALLGDGATTVSKSMSVTDGEEGKCTVTFAATDLDVNGYAYGEIEVTFADATVQHVKFAIEFYVRDEYEVVPWQ